ncbi:hypothetical protein [Fluviicola sp.]|uniref:hypothetical protein n=1 Tax=Fluviicola sp. TaxID=1917219 RepID=UPI003D2E37B1
MYKYIFILLILLSGNQWVSAQETSMEQYERELVQISGKVGAARYGDYDSLTYYSDLFSHKLYSLLSRVYGTMKYPFNILKEEHVCDISISKDGLFRIYSWDTQTGGTMRFFKTIYQYKVNGEVRTKMCELNEGDPGCFYSEIFTLKAKKKTYYLGIANGIYSTKDVSQSIQAFELTNTGVNDSIQLMKTPDGMKNSLDLSYDFFSVVDRPERPVAVIRYDEKKKIISISTTNEKGEVVPGNKFYRFNGRYFEEVKTTPKSKK